MAITKKDRRLRIRRSIRKKLNGTSDRPRLSVYKSNTAIYVQIIDDLSGKTLAAASSKGLSSGKSINIEASKKVGTKIAEVASAAGISNVIFDRSGYQYHGKIQALAEGAREGGLKF